MPRKQIIAIVGTLGIYPMTRLSVPARRILAYLASRGRPVPRAQAAAELWPDLPEEAGRANLRRALWNAPGGWIETCGDDLVLHAATDLEAAEAAAARAMAGEEIGYEDIRLLSEDILPGWQEEWIVPLHERFRGLRVQALEAACRTLTRTGNLPLAVSAGAAAVAAEPLRESAAEALIEAHMAQRNRYAALQCYRALERELARELGVSPDPDLAAKFEQTVAA